MAISVGIFAVEHFNPHSATTAAFRKKTIRS
jgi:hypothetical protein